jgi:oligoribonuclease NrnB/cAMP/cGMP phosphodiesterase (DHH superfamily)
MKCFHHNDLDGKCAGAVVAQFTQNYNQDDYFEVDYIKPLPIDKISENEEVYLVDYSFKEDTVWQLDKILKKTPNVIWCDHHTSSLKLLEQRPELKQIKGIIKDKVSGALLIYEYLYNNPEEIPYYIQLVSDYDCWIYDLDPDTTHFKIGIDTVKHNALNNIWVTLYKEFNEEYVKECYLYEDNYQIMIQRLINKGIIIKNYINQDNTQYRQAWSYESEIEGYKCLVINRKSNSWIFGDKVKEYPITMVWAFNGEKYSYSIYSIDKTVDCSKIAEKFGGGGHKGAAGFSSNELLFKKN